MSTHKALFGSRFAAGFGKAWLVGGFAFLYLPMLTLIIFSFNKSPLPSVWGGFTLEWYQKLAGDGEILAGLWLSLKIAFWSATLSVVFGTLAAFAMVKYRRFFGRTLFTGMVNAPLVMPEVIQGLSLLLMLVAIQKAIGFPERGFLTILLGHLVLGLSYAAVVVSARLQELNPQLEEAAMVDGCTRLGAFLRVVLPLSLPGLITVAIFSFLLSWTDYTFALIMIGSDANKTLPVGLASMVGSFDLRWGEIMAGSTLIALPLFAAFALLTQYFIQGLGAGAVKG